MNIAPFPRYRLYTTSSHYFEFFRSLLGSDLTPVVIEQLEHALCEFLDTPNAMCVPQNRVGVYLLLKQLLRENREVVMSPYTIADIVNMVICAGGKPVFADIERETCNIDPDEIERLTTKDTGAVLITHLHGLSCDTPRIQAVCDALNVPLIEDAAQAFGAKTGSQRTGTLGRAGVFSFGLFKNITSFWGGAVISPDADLIRSMRHECASLRWMRRKEIFTKVKKGLLTDVATHPILFKLFTFWVFRYGFLNDVEAINRRVRTELDTGPKSDLPEWYLSRYTPTQAKMVLRQLSQVDAHSQERIAKAQIYHDGLSDLSELIIPPNRTDGSHIYTYFPIQHHNREGLLKHLMREKRDIAAQHYKNCADLPGFSEFYRDCPHARSVSEQLIFLPTYAGYPTSDVERNVTSIRRYFNK